jgi:hypothetical protein
VPAASANGRSLTQAEQRELQTRMEKKQVKEFMNVWNYRIAMPFRLSVAA